MKTPDVKAFFDKETFTVSYIVSDPTTGRAAVIDPVLNYDPASGRTDTRSADEMITFLTESNLVVDWIIETHVHADHLSSAPYIKDSVGGQTGIGNRVTEVQGPLRVFSISRRSLAMAVSSTTCSLMASHFVSVSSKPG